MLGVVAFLTESVVVGSYCIFDTERSCYVLGRLGVVVALLVENVVDKQSNMGAHFVSQCFVVIRCNMRRSPPCHRTPNMGCCFSCLHVQNLES